MIITQGRIKETEIEIQRKIREAKIDFDVIEIEIKDDQFHVEIFEKMIQNSEFLKLVDMMKKEYDADLKWIEPSYYGLILIFYFEDGNNKEVESQ